jgi:hydrogenase expression/formation protein HypE
MKFPLGKIPPKPLMEIVFNYLGAKRSDVILGASHGEDAAIVKAGKQLLALSCDPISGALGRLGHLSVRVTTNDIATRGVRPTWFLSCILLPEGSGERVLREICRQMDEAAKKINVAIVGGHSEVTPGLDHPVIIGFAAGVVGRHGYVTCRGARPGGKIILTKGAGVEGTAILASDRATVLRPVFGDRLLKRASRFFEVTSVVEDAMTAFSHGLVQAMHDPTEGGVAGGLNELANASKTGFRVYEESIEIAPETSEICRFFKIDPLRLVGSGSLLIVATEKSVEGILSHLKRRKIRAAVIGEVLSNPAKRILVKRNGVERKLPLPYADDLWIALRRKPSSLR